MKKIAALLMGIVLACFAATGMAAAEDAAMVVDLTGGQATYQAGAKTGQEVMLMDFLAAGDRIKVGSGANLILNYFASGAREEISGPGSITIGANGSKKTGGAKVKAEKVDYIPQQAAAGSGDSQHAGVVAMRDISPGGKNVLTFGLSETATRSLPLTFKWQDVKNAQEYKVVVTNVDDKMLFETTTKNTMVVCQKANLPRGKELWWTVEAMAGGQMIADGGGQFYLLPGDSLNQLKHTEKYIKAQYRQGSTESMIAMAMLYKKFQLNDDAKTVLLSLKKKHPQNNNINRYLFQLKGNYSPES